MVYSQEEIYEATGELLGEWLADKGLSGADILWDEDGEAYVMEEEPMMDDIEPDRGGYLKVAVPKFTDAEATKWLDANPND